jgi:type II secretory pathway pseudopilin PulG
MKKIFQHILKSQAGVTLVELMVYVGMLGGVSLLVATLATNMNRSAVVREADLMAAEFMQDVQLKLSLKDNCDHNFEGRNSTSAGAAFKFPNEIRNTDDKVLFSIGQKLDNYFTLSDMSMAKINDTRADITLQFSRSGTKSNAVTSLTRKLKLTVEHEADGTTIRSCLVSFDQITGDQLPLICNGEGTILSDAGTPSETSDDVCVHAGYSMERCPDGEFVQRFELVNRDDGTGKLQPFYRPVCIAANVPRSLLCPAGEVLQGYSAEDGGLICRPLMIKDLWPHMLGDYTACGIDEEFPIKMVGSNINIHCGPDIAPPAETATPVSTNTPSGATPTPTPIGSDCVTVSDDRFVVQVPFTTPLDPLTGAGRKAILNIYGVKKDGSKLQFRVMFGVTDDNKLHLKFKEIGVGGDWPKAVYAMLNSTMTMNYLYLIRVQGVGAGKAGTYGNFHIGMSEAYPTGVVKSVVCSFGEPVANCGMIVDDPFTNLEGVKPLTVCIDANTMVPIWDTADPFNVWALP